MSSQPIKMDVTITYNEVAPLVRNNIPTLEPTQTSNAFALYVGTLNVPYNDYHAHKASSMAGKVW
jgi:hypothetical protein